MYDTETVVPKILSELCSPNMSPSQHLEKQQALVKQFAEILEFVLKFDEHKVKTIFLCLQLYVQKIKTCKLSDDDSVNPEWF